MWFDDETDQEIEIKSYDSETLQTIASNGQVDSKTAGSASEKVASIRVNAKKCKSVSETGLNCFICKFESREHEIMKKGDVIGLRVNRLTFYSLIFLVNGDLIDAAKKASGS